MILGCRHLFLRLGRNLGNTLVFRSRLGGAPILNSLAHLWESRKVALHLFDGLVLTFKPQFDHLKPAGVYFVCLGDPVQFVFELRDSLFNSLDMSQVLLEIFVPTLETPYVTFEVFQGRGAAGRCLGALKRARITRGGHSLG